MFLEYVILEKAVTTRNAASEMTMPFRISPRVSVRYDFSLIFLPMTSSNQAVSMFNDPERRTRAHQVSCALVNRGLQTLSRLR
jgi:hypothetical protein